MDTDTKKEALREARYYAKGVIVTLAAGLVAGSLFMYLVTPKTGGMDPRTGDIVIDTEPIYTALPVVVLSCFVVYGFLQCWRHRPKSRVFRCVRFLGLLWSVSLLPLAIMGLEECAFPASNAGPFNFSMFALAGIGVFAPLALMELLGASAFYLLGGGKPSTRSRRINPELASRIERRLGRVRKK